MIIENSEQRFDFSMYENSSIIKKTGVSLLQ